VNIKTFESQVEYREWLASVGDLVRVHNQVPLFARQSLWRRIQSLWRGPGCAVTYEDARVTLVSTQSKTCKQCGATNSPDDKFCQECGIPLFIPRYLAPVEPPETSETVPDPIVTRSLEPIPTNPEMVS
jgi:hypothetical protein